MQTNFPPSKRLVLFRNRGLPPQLRRPMPTATKTQGPSYNAQFDQTGDINLVYS
ncbi:uncharacterized protein PHACADRAFT_252800 [Phanerochaete carnosa HHB-10118-sp]|uniref:Uncharacterized protein n=1 Tax=Phanerochaete carnosa (strain HHB-10118-sp) TaxID=650164 RepID=K5X6H8_PHACS|nr:uncharacterized protein PHACADRAFT_252800 [Phanerochaete carnosa HHB-10118-sp]EKM58462.1 hypothetical protein PHACADRAFT_252800 [Phanerochaete carnosa HHB-10118-sp]